MILVLSGFAVWNLGHRLQSSEKDTCGHQTQRSRHGAHRTIANASIAIPTAKNETEKTIAAHKENRMETGDDRIISNRFSQSANHQLTSGRHKHAATSSGLLRVAVLPFTFSIPDEQLTAGSAGNEALHQAKAKFADALNSESQADPASPEYADRWNRAATAHDDFLRLQLGGPAYVRLTAVAMQAEQAARERESDKNLPHETRAPEP